MNEAEVLQTISSKTYPGLLLVCQEVSVYLCVREENLLGNA